MTGKLLFPFNLTAGAFVCYVGDEANSIKGEPSLKLLPDQNPCECTEFRPGGVNTKRQAKPREVTFGNDGHPEGWTDKDCIQGIELIKSYNYFNFVLFILYTFLFLMLHFAAISKYVVFGYQNAT